MPRDPWEEICKEALVQLDPPRFVSQNIPAEIIRKHGDPRYIIPIYSKEALSRRFPFLKQYGLCPLRTGIGEAVLTKADLFRRIYSVKIPAQKLEVKPQEACAFSLRALHTETVDTEAKFLVSALKSGVFHSAFKIPPEEKLSLGLFGKMNLPSLEITLRDYDNGGKDYSLRLSNVQFELDISLEDSNFLYLVEAKRGVASTFSVLQLFYPMLMVRNYGRKTGKKVRAFLADITSISQFEIKYQFTECIFEQDLVPNSATLSESKIVDLLFQDPATSKLEDFS